MCTLVLILFLLNFPVKQCIETIMVQMVYFLPKQAQYLPSPRLKTDNISLWTYEK